MRKVLVFATVLALGFLAAPALGEENVLPLFTRALETEGLTLNLVHVNNATVDSLFTAPSKYSIRARANQVALFYVQGRPQEAGKLSTDFALEQNGQTVAGVVHNIQNFVAGDVAAGTKLDALLEFPTKLDPSRPFTVRNGKAAVSFELSAKALELLKASQPPTATQ
ncbi:MAG: hypothetical protein Kow00109_23920 [Acidobacteriota bacterium]